MRLQLELRRAVGATRGICVCVCVCVRAYTPSGCVAICFPWFDMSSKHLWQTVGEMRWISSDEDECSCSSLIVCYFHLHVWVDASGGLLFHKQLGFYMASNPNVRLNVPLVNTVMSVQPLDLNITLKKTWKTRSVHSFSLQKKRRMVAQCSSMWICINKTTKTRTGTR